MYGFETNDHTVYTAPVTDGTFEIKLTEKTAQYTLRRDEGKIEGYPTLYESLEMDIASDTLHGIGLYTLFDVDTFEGGEPPVWYSQQVRDAIVGRPPTIPSSLSGRMH